MPRKNKKQAITAAAYRRLKKINAELMAYAPRPVCERIEKLGVADQADSDPRPCHVCVLYSDIRGFTELSRVLDNQGLFFTAKMSSARQTAVIESYGGYVDNYPGDGVMAVFEGKDKVEKACECALDLIALVARAGDGGKPVSLAVGLHVGGVVMGNLGSVERRSYTAIGDTVNVAAKLCNHARTPEVIASGAVRSALPDASSMLFEDLPSAVIPGIEAHLPAYRLYRA